MLSQCSNLNKSLLEILLKAICYPLILMNWIYLLFPNHKREIFCFLVLLMAQREFIAHIGFRNPSFLLGNESENGCNEDWECNNKWRRVYYHSRKNGFIWLRHFLKAKWDWRKLFLLEKGFIGGFTWRNTIWLRRLIGKKMLESGACHLGNSSVRTLRVRLTFRMFSWWRIKMLLESRARKRISLKL